MKYKYPDQKFISRFLGFFMFFSLVFIVIISNRFFRYGYDAFVHTNYLLFTKPFHSVSNFFGEFQHFREISAEYRKLLKEKASYQQVFHHNQRLQQELQELQALMKMENYPDNFDRIYTQVISRDVEHYFDYVIINKGEQQGIKMDALVINEHGLVGKVVKVHPLTSVVRLMSSKQDFNNLLVQVNSEGEESFDAVLFGYDSRSKHLLARTFSENVVDHKKYVVHTNNFHHLHPKNLFIGRVVKSEDFNDKIGKLLYIETKVNFHHLDNMIVVNPRD